MFPIRRVCHHAGWFALLGPLVGVIVTISSIALSNPESAGELLVHIMNIFPLFLVLTWITGGVPALLAGMAVACLPDNIHARAPLRLIAGGMAGVVISTGVALLLNTPIVSRLSLNDIFTPAAFIFTAGPGLFAGVVMSALITRLPGRGPIVNSFRAAPASAPAPVDVG